MPTSKWERFWTWLSRTADAIQVFGTAIVAAGVAVWLFIKSVPAPVIVLVSVGVFVLVLGLLIRFIPSRWTTESRAPVTGHALSDLSTREAVVSEERSGWRPYHEVFQKQIFFHLKNEGSEREARIIRCIVQDPNGNQAVGENPKMPIRTGSIAYFNYPAVFVGPGSLIDGAYRVVWESKVDLMTPAVRLSDETLDVLLPKPPSPPDEPTSPLTDARRKAFLTRLNDLTELQKKALRDLCIEPMTSDRYYGDLEMRGLRPDGCITMLIRAGLVQEDHGTHICRVAEVYRPFVEEWINETSS